MKVLLTGMNGQLGRCFCDRCPSDWTLIATDRKQLDLTNLTELDTFLAKHRPTAIVNAAAYTSVDKAETESELARQVNDVAPKQLAILAKKYAAKFVHISTDYVFDGRSCEPYLETDLTNPINVYGKSKRNGEIAIQENNPNAIIIRTSWVFSEYGNNFVKTMLKLATSRAELSVIYDQIGCPTYAGDIATTIIELLNSQVAGGIYHYCGDLPVSWFEFAEKIFEVAAKTGALVNIPTVKAIKSDEYPAQAKRPNYSILSMQKMTKLGIQGSNWKAALNQIIPSLSRS